MREIKFRAFYQGKMYYSCNDYTVWAGGKNASITGDGIGGTILTEDVMQFTGLHDKNGKMIYEGDIIKFKAWGNSWTGEVKYYYGGFSPFYSRDAKIDFGDVDNEVCEVIGNIYENKELLNG